jgi:pterin-4a-carbinolamine dehydratase
VNTISVKVLLDSDLITTEETYDLIERYVFYPQITAAEILELDLPAKNRVEALLQPEFLTETQLRELACDFAEHVLPLFEIHAKGDFHPRRCVDVARLCLRGRASSEELRIAIRDARPSMWHFQGSEHEAAFEASYTVLWLDFEDAAMMARDIANYAQRAAHHQIWERRKSIVVPMIGREKEAAWQLARIMNNL